MLLVRRALGAFKPSSSKPWFPVSANECSASASMALLPEITAAAVLATAIAALAASAV